MIDGKNVIFRGYCICADRVLSTRARSVCVPAVCSCSQPSSTSFFRNSLPLPSKKIYRFIACVKLILIINQPISG